MKYIHNGAYYSGVSLQEDMLQVVTEMAKTFIAMVIILRAKFWSYLILLFRMDAGHNGHNESDFNLIQLGYRLNADKDNTGFHRMTISGQAWNYRNFRIGSLVCVGEDSYCGTKQRSSNSSIHNSGTPLALCDDDAQPLLYDLLIKPMEDALFSSSESGCYKVM